MLCYRTRLLPRAKRDLRRICRYMRKYNFKKIIERIYRDIGNLTFMPRTHKTLIYFKDKKGEYRRIVSGKYIIIYKIVKDEIIILRIFNQKENYLNQKSFILKENSERYNLKIRRSSMNKLKTLKNSYLESKENFIYIIKPEDKYINKLIEEVESVPEEERIYYTEKEFWALVEKMEIEKYGCSI